MIRKLKISIYIILATMAFCTIFSGTGFAETKNLSPPKTDTPPTIDGVLDDPAWENAAKGGDFAARKTSEPASEPTEIFVCYDDTNLYFAFYCHDSQPDKITGTQRERDGYLWNDDLVWITLDTYNDHLAVDQFFVNAIGTQRDTRSRETADKVEWKGDWLAAVSCVEDGWLVEIAIPFSILKYKCGATTMGFCATREIRRLDERSDWIVLGNNFNLSDYGHLENLVLPEPKRKPLKIMPYLLFEASEEYNKGRFGVDLKQEFEGDNAILLSVFPDFGTVENAVKSIDFSYTAHRYSDTRPFFQEARGIFNSQYIYTTSIPDFDIGIKSFGRFGKMQYGAMRCMKIGDRDDSIITASYDFSDDGNAKIMLINRDDDDVNNTVLSYSMSGEIAKDTGLWMNGGQSYTTGAEEDGTDVDTGLWFSNDRVFLNCSFGESSRFFNPASGYINYPGSKNWQLSTGYWIEKPGKSIRDYGVNLWHGRRWDNDHGLIYTDSNISGWLSFDNHTSWYIAHNWGHHIANYHDDPDVGYYLNTDTMSSVHFNFNTDDNYRSGTIAYSWGKEAGGPSETIRFQCGFLPSKNFSTDLSVNRVHRNNDEEGDITKWQGILGAKYEITPEKSISSRVLYQEEGTNFTLSYRQQVRKGLDIFALYGDYNADKTVNKFSIKLVMAL